jgi:hypothetical protein
MYKLTGAMLSVFCEPRADIVSPSLMVIAYSDPSTCTLSLKLKLLKRIATKFALA